MDISELSTTELLAELKSRTEKPANKKHVLVFGTIGIQNKKYFVEVFKEIHTEKDFDFLKNASLRARFNPDRYYEGFYFKTNIFKELKENLNKDRTSFAQWIKSTASVKYIGL